MFPVAPGCGRRTQFTLVFPSWQRYFLRSNATEQNRSTPKLRIRRFEVRIFTGALALRNFAGCGSIRAGEIISMAGQGSTGNVIAALCSFFIPGLGQLLQGRLLMAILQFVLAAVLWFILLGWLVHLWSILDAALYKPRV
jgi:hypothetical protein